MTKYEIARWYGREMQRYGLFLQYTIHNGGDPSSLNDPTQKLMAYDDFNSLSEDDKETILKYGNNMKRFYMGMYATCGDCYDYYEECRGCPPSNPFYRENAIDDE